MKIKNYYDPPRRGHLFMFVHAFSLSFLTSEDSGHDLQESSVAIVIWAVFTTA